MQPRLHMGVSSRTFVFTKRSKSVARECVSGITHISMISVLVLGTIKHVSVISKQPQVFSDACFIYLLDLIS